MKKLIYIIGIGLIPLAFNNCSGIDSDSGSNQGSDIFKNSDNRDQNDFNNVVNPGSGGSTGGTGSTGTGGGNPTPTPPPPSQFRPNEPGNRVAAQIPAQVLRRNDWNWGQRWISDGSWIHPFNFSVTGISSYKLPKIYNRAESCSVSNGISRYNRTFTLGGQYSIEYEFFSAASGHCFTVLWLSETAGDTNPINVPKECFAKDLNGIMAFATGSNNSGCYLKPGKEYYLNMSSIDYFHPRRLIPDPNMPGGAPSGPLFSGISQGQDGNYLVNNGLSCITDYDNQFGPTFSPHASGLANNHFTIGGTPHVIVEAYGEYAAGSPSDRCNGQSSFTILD